MLIAESRNGIKALLVSAVPQNIRAFVFHAINYFRLDDNKHGLAFQPLPLFNFFKTGNNTISKDTAIIVQAIG